MSNISNTGVSNLGNLGEDPVGNLGEDPVGPYQGEEEPVGPGPENGVQEVAQRLLFEENSSSYRPRRDERSKGSKDGG